MHHGTDASGNAHAEEIHDGAERDCAFRHQTMGHVVIMGRQTVTGRDRDAASFQDLLPDGSAPQILPGIERTQRTAGMVRVNDSVHLAGKTDGGGQL